MKRKKATTTHAAELRAYSLSFLPLHLARSHGVDELAKLLTTFSFLEEKLKLFDIQQLITDYEHTDGPELKLVQRALQLSSHILRDDKSQLVSQLHGRLLRYADHQPLKLLFDETTRVQDTVWLRALNAALNSPGAAAVRVLPWTRPSVSGSVQVYIAPDQTCVITLFDRTVRVWDIQTGEQLNSLLEGAGDERSTFVGILPYGHALVISNGQELATFDALTGEQINILPVPSRSVQRI